MATVNLDTASRLDIVCRKGDSFKLEIDFGAEIPGTAGNNVYLMKVATSDTATVETLVFTYAVGDNADAVTNAQLTIEASDEDMRGIDSGLYVYDLEVEDVDADVYAAVDGQPRVKTLLYGTFKVVEDITETA